MMTCHQSGSLFALLFDWRGFLAIARKYQYDAFQKSVSFAVTERSAYVPTARHLDLGRGGERAPKQTTVGSHGLFHPTKGSPRPQAASLPAQELRVTRGRATRASETACRLCNVCRHRCIGIVVVNERKAGGTDRGCRTP